MITRIDSTRDIVNGAVVVSPRSGGAVSSFTYDNRQRTHHLASGEVTSLQTGANRYHGGDWADSYGVETFTAADANTAGNNNDAVLYYPALAGRRHVLLGLGWGYNSAPASGAYVQVQSPSGTTVFREPVTAAGAGFFTFPQGLPCAQAQDVLVSLSSGNSPKYLSLLGRRIE